MLLCMGWMDGMIFLFWTIGVYKHYREVYYPCLSKWKALSPCKPSQRSQHACSWLLLSRLREQFLCSAGRCWFPRATSPVSCNRSDQPDSPTSWLIAQKSLWRAERECVNGSPLCATLLKGLLPGRALIMRV